MYKVHLCYYDRDRCLKVELLDQREGAFGIFISSTHLSFQKALPTYIHYSKWWCSFLYILAHSVILLTFFILPTLWAKMRVWLLFIWSLMKLIFLSYFYCLILFLLWIYRSLFRVFFIWLVAFSGRSIESLHIVKILTPLLSLYVVNIFPWSVLCLLLMGSCTVKPFLIFMCQIGLTFSLWSPCSVTSIEEALLFQYYKIIFLFYSGTFIVLVFCFYFTWSLFLCG